jgi:hypothetical protein
MNNKILAIFLFLFGCSAWAQDCENTAQAVTEIREDYKSFAELKGDLSLKVAALGGVVSYALRAQIENEIEMKLIYGEMAFTHYPKSLKGDKLYKKVLADCLAEEKRTAERRARQEARAAAKAAKEAK